MKAAAVDALLDFARNEGIGLTVVGPEQPLEAGIVDSFRSAGMKIVGPRRDAARLESSKVFSKDFMKRHNIPTAATMCSATGGVRWLILIHFRLRVGRRF